MLCTCPADKDAIKLAPPNTELIRRSKPRSRRTTRPLHSVREITSNKCLFPYHQLRGFRSRSFFERSHFQRGLYPLVYVGRILNCKCEKLVAVHMANRKNKQPVCSMNTCSCLNYGFLTYYYKPKLAANDRSHR